MKKIKKIEKFYAELKSSSNLFDRLEFEDKTFLWVFGNSDVEITNSQSAELEEKYKNYVNSKPL